MLDTLYPIIVWELSSKPFAYLIRTFCWWIIYLPTHAMLSNTFSALYYIQQHNYNACHSIRGWERFVQFVALATYEPIGTPSSHSLARAQAVCKLSWPGCEAKPSYADTELSKPQQWSQQGPYNMIIGSSWYFTSKDPSRSCKDHIQTPDIQAPGAIWFRKWRVPYLYLLF